MPCWFFFFFALGANFFLGFGASFFFAGDCGAPFFFA
jgi:hypothetical protein